MTLSESLALCDDGHILYHKTFVDCSSLTFNYKKRKKEKKNKQLAANLKRSSLNVQAQIVSKHTYLHHKIKTKMEGTHKINAHPPL